MITIGRHFAAVELTPSGIDPRFDRVNQEVRKNISGLMQSSIWALYAARMEMSPIIPKGSVLVPVPDKGGNIEATTALCGALATATGCHVRAIVARRPGGKVYALGSAGYTLSQFDPSVQVVFIDIFSCNGEEFDECASSLGVGYGIAYAATQYPWLCDIVPASGFSLSQKLFLGSFIVFQIILGAWAAYSEFSARKGKRDA